MTDDKLRAEALAIARKHMANDPCPVPARLLMPVEWVIAALVEALRMRETALEALRKIEDEDIEETDDDRGDSRDDAIRMVQIARKALTAIDTAPSPAPDGAAPKTAVGAQLIYDEARKRLTEAPAPDVVAVLDAMPPRPPHDYGGTLPSVPADVAELVERLRLRAGYSERHPEHVRMFGSVNAKLHCEAATMLESLSCTRGEQSEAEADAGHASLQARRLLWLLTPSNIDRPAWRVCIVHARERTLAQKLAAIDEALAAKPDKGEGR